LVKHFGSSVIWLFCALLALVWLGLGLSMTMPAPRIRQPSV